MTFKLHARVNRTDAESIRQALADLAAKTNITREGDEIPRRSNHLWIISTDSLLLPI
jgi:hypothetical protein